MAAPALSTPFRFTAYGKTVYLVSTISDITAPTRLELDAGHNITKHLPGDGVQGFELTHATVDSKDLATGIGYKLNDGDDYGTPMLTCFQSKNETGHTDIRSILNEGDTTNVVLFDSVDTAGLKMDVFQVVATKFSKARASGAHLLINVPFDIVDSARDVTVPS